MYDLPRGICKGNHDDPKLVKQQRNEAIRDKVFLSLSTCLYLTASWIRFHCDLRLRVCLKSRETLQSFKIHHACIQLVLFSTFSNFSHIVFCFAITGYYTRRPSQTPRDGRTSCQVLQEAKVLDGTTRCHDQNW